MRNILFAAGMCLLIIASQVLAQVPGTRLASFDRPPSTVAVEFQRRQAQVGDQTGQHFTVRMDLKNTVRQGHQVVGKFVSRIEQQQHRVITAADIVDSRMTAARVRYVVSKKTMTGDGKSNPPTDDPVAGNTYRCQRRGEQLQITDVDGNSPPLAEFEIVSRSMESLGQPNPLAEFLAGKEIAVGQTVALPTKWAEQLLGLGDAVDQVERFDMTLTGRELVAGSRCALFEARVEVTDHSNGQMRMQLEGPMAVEITGCRLVNAELEGPIGVAESAGSLGAVYHMTGTGRLSVRIESSYRDMP